MPEFSVEAYSDAREQASDETRIAIANFPACPTPKFERALSAALTGDDFEF